jgi:signal transduction histidine kinase
MDITSSIRSTTWQDWTVFVLRWLLLLVVALILPRSQTEPAPNIGLPALVLVVANIVLAVFILYPTLHKIIPGVIVAGDWAITAAFINLINPEATVLVLGIVGFIVMSGLLRLGPVWGAAQTIGVFIIALMSLSTKTAQPLNAVIASLGPTFPILLLFAIATGAWSFILNRLVKSLQSHMTQHEENATEQVKELRTRTRAIYEMAVQLSTTLDYERILSAALTATDGVGLSQQVRALGQVVSAALLFRAEDNQLQVVTGRRLTRRDQSLVLKGAEGLLEQALKDARPVFGKRAAKDPELQYLAGFQDTRSVVCIPLRAGFETYGVLLYGSSLPDAFSEDQVDLLMAIGIQATVALQNAALYNSLMDERNRIIQVEKSARDSLARDLHDGPTQDVAVIAMKMGIITRMLERTPDEVPNELKKVEDLARKTTKVIRHMLFILRPQVLENQGLSVALDDMAKKMEDTYGQVMAVRVSWDAERCLDPDQKNVIFQIVQEAVSNARKHAQADLVQVTVEQRDDYVITEVADNGVGFEVDAVTANYDQRGSFGMLNLRERTELIGGTFQIRSAVGKGTTITCHVPIRQSGDPTKPDGQRVQLPATKLSDHARKRLEDAS